MKTHKLLQLLTMVLSIAALVVPAFAQDKKPTDAPSEAEMMAKMAELAKPGPQHKVLEGFVGNWTYQIKMWMSPDTNAPPSESSGTSVVKAVMDGRYIISTHTGKMQMPGPDGKMKDEDFKGIGTDGYDNAKQKFVSSWIDNMGTGIMHAEGTYDTASKTLTYLMECEMMPGVKSKIREVMKIVDHDHHTFEFFEDRGGTEFKTMEITYKRKG